MVNATAKMTLGQMSEFFGLRCCSSCASGREKDAFGGHAGVDRPVPPFTFGNNDSLVFMYYGGICCTASATTSS